MKNANIINTEVLNNIIIGRVDPKIYAFTTETIPNYLKVGDTYRPLGIRLDEWRKYFPNLKNRFDDLAMVDEETFFRDHAVHYFLENEKGRERLKKGDIKNISHYSNEFFKGATKKDVEGAIKDIKKGYKDNHNKYQYYKYDESRVPLTHTYSREADYNPRPNQEKTIKKFKKAVDSNRNNLLMYAVMRFGKSFTSMCCAIEIKASTVLIVSAKADVQEEWKKTVESHKKFSDYIFLDNRQLLDSETVIKNSQKSGKKTVIFLTLQDLQGKEVKKKHKEIFKNRIDLLIIDETHFGARAEEYGRVLRDTSVTNKNDIKQELRLNDESLGDLENEIKTLNAKTRLHLSGTPYRILMGSEFKDEDIIAFYQFSDIVEDQRKWDEKNLHKDDIKEWSNPYYGFPQMVRFAFHPNESSRKKMEVLKSHGISYALSELLKPKSIKKDTKNNSHKKFKHGSEVIDLFKAIDGSKKDENILNFLDYKKIQEGKMCRHIVCVLPYRASCDALEALLKNKKLKNLGEYKIINISGVDGGKKYKTTQSVQSKIKDCEANNQKSITLTVNRMLTGSTVPEWDTMLYFKDTASPQEYDQAVFRLQNQYVRTYTDQNYDTVKFNMKPQTLLVDFSPNRMLEMQEQKALIYNANTDKSGNTELKKQIQRELDISPIIVLNKNKIQKITPSDILDAVREYSKDRGVDDEAREIPIDIKLLKVPEIRAEIEKQNEIGSKQGLEISVAEGEGSHIDIEDKKGTKEDITDKDLSTAENKAEEDFRKKFATYYMRILFFAFLTNSNVESLQDIVKAIRIDKNNQRIIKNLEINTNVLALFQKNVNPFAVIELDRKIHNINSLANDKDIATEDRAKIAMQKFTRLSESEIVTPEFIADKMIDSLPKKEIQPSTKILDMASKQGEFVYAIYRKFGKKIANNVYSISTSRSAYEFTRKIYESLDLDVDNIEKEYTAYQLIEHDKIIDGENVKINNMSMKFDVIVGNPPYQINTDTNFATPVYHLFFEAAKSLEPDYISLIHPARFLFNAGATPKKWNKQMLNDPRLSVPMYEPNSKKIFSDVDIKGGLCITFWNKNNLSGGLGGKFVAHNELKLILRKVGIGGFDTLVGTAGGSPTVRYEDKFGRKRSYFRTSAFFDMPDFFSEKKDSKHNIKIVGLQKGNKRTERYVNQAMLKDASLYKWKILIPKSNGTGKFGEVLSTPIISEPSTGCTESFIQIGPFETEKEANSCMKYLKTKFCRALLATLKITQDNPKSVWKNVPLQDFTVKSDINWYQSINDIDKQLYKKYNLDQKEIDFIKSHVKLMK